MTCDCPSHDYWQTGLDGAHQHVIETPHRLGCENVADLLLYGEGTE